jgi:16S rRNA (cytosine1402-N4)-methyltransferase
MSTKALHQPVMLTEAIKFLQVQPDKWYVDATFGRGGHTKAILNQGGRVIAFDFDTEAIKYGKQTCATSIKAGKLILVQANFTHLKETVDNLRKKEVVDRVWGVLFDFGTSVDQLKSATRGFSFEVEAPLDMRMDQDLGVTAADLIKVLSEKQLTEIFLTYGGEKQARQIAKAIKIADKPPETTTELVKIIQQIKPYRQGKLHPATKVFQALRIAVNTELENIQETLPEALDIIEPGGHLVTISFHEGEDRLVKHFFKQAETENLGEILTKKPLTPGEIEQTKNPRARSAKLRALRKKT